MKIVRPVRGPRLRSKLLLAGLVLLSIPWLGYQTLQIMKEFLVDGQARSQLLIANSVATLLNDRDELFNATADRDGEPELPLYPLNIRIQVDGYAEDWSSLESVQRHFGPAGGGFDLLLGSDGSHLYGLVRVLDATPVNANPTQSSLDQADHLRLAFVDSGNEVQRLVLNFEGSGSVNAWPADKSWRRMRANERDWRIHARVNRWHDYYLLEFSLPLNALAIPPSLSITMYDQDKPAGIPPKVWSTTPRDRPNALSPLLQRSAFGEQVLDSVATQNIRIWILDTSQRVRAVRGALRSGYSSPKPTPSNSGLWHRWTGLFANLISNLLIGRDRVTLRYPADITTRRNDVFLPGVMGGDAWYGQTDYGVIIAAQPLYQGNRVVGAVLIEQTVNELVDLQRDTLARVAQLTLVTLIAVLLVLLSFSGRLTMRIRRLEHTTRKAIDAAGRLHEPTPLPDREAGDEIGDLARGIGQMLEKLHDHQQFMSSIPRTLRHEINNPLNTISTSLEALSHGLQERDAAQLASARRGLQRIRQMVQSLTEAASLDEAVLKEKLERLDLNRLVCSYCENRGRLLGPGTFVVQSANQNLTVLGCDYLLEQLLDKIADNALDFRLPGSAIRVAIGPVRDAAIVSISNSGPLISEKQLRHIFQFMSSERSGGGAKEGHFGLGLFIAKTIAERHGGTLKAGNLEDGTGVRITLVIPLTD